MNRTIAKVLLLTRRIRTYFLILELRKISFFIGGYKDCMVYTGYRYLKKWEVKAVHKLRRSGKIEFSHQRSITSPNTGIQYTDDYFKISK